MRMVAGVDKTVKGVNGTFQSILVLQEDSEKRVEGTFWQTGS